METLGTGLAIFLGTPIAKTCYWFFKTKTSGQASIIKQTHLRTCQELGRWGTFSGNMTQISFVPRDIFRPVRMKGVDLPVERSMTDMTFSRSRSYQWADDKPSWRAVPALSCLWGHHLQWHGTGELFQQVWGGSRTLRGGGYTHQASMRMWLRCASQQDRGSKMPSGFQILIAQSQQVTLPRLPPAEWRITGFLSKEIDAWNCTHLSWRVKKKYSIQSRAGAMLQHCSVHWTTDSHSLKQELLQTLNKSTAISRESARNGINYTNVIVYQSCFQSFLYSIACIIMNWW